MSFARIRSRLAGISTIPAILALTGAQGCGAGSAAPERAEQVRIELAVSGGIAGTDWAITIDGARGLIIGERCRGPVGCDWSDGETLAAVDDAAVLALAGRFAEEGFFALDRTDFGTECCDQFDYALAYVDEERERTVRGSDGTIPESVSRLVSAVRSFVADARGP